MMTATTELTMSSPVQEGKAEDRSAGTTRRSKRLTVNFPILPPTTAPLDQIRATSPPQSAAPPDSTRSSPRPASVSASPTTESSPFLTSLAAQERLVLELREELQKAEVDLSRLKRQWAQYEAGRKKNELRQVEQMQQMPASPFFNSTAPPPPNFNHNHDPNSGDGDLSRRSPAAVLRASLENGTDRPVIRKSTQRLFSGSRNTRALSLLSPEAKANNPSPTGRPVEGALSPTLTTTDIHSPSLGFNRTYKQLAARRSIPSSSSSSIPPLPPSLAPAKEMIVTNGKKMAADLRAGFYTFFEDIRQATVGEEAIYGVDARARAGSGIDAGSIPSATQRQGLKSSQPDEAEWGESASRSANRATASVAARRDRTRAKSLDPF